jgi:hypothetical protein
VRLPITQVAPAPLLHVVDAKRVEAAAMVVSALKAVVHAHQDMANHQSTEVLFRVREDASKAVPEWIQSIRYNNAINE